MQRKLFQILAYMLVSATKKHKIDEYLNDCICMKSVFDKLVVICKGDMVNTSTNSFDKEEHIK